MLDQLELHNFKCFRQKRLVLRPLTILCGHNAVGKSSVIQSILLAQQAGGLEPGSRATIPLNGPFGLELGTVGDIFSHAAVERTIEIRIVAGKNISSLECLASDDTWEEHFLTASLHGARMPHPLHQHSGLEFAYLSADRQGPRDTQPLQSRPKDQLIIGSRGEFAAEILSRFERHTIRDRVRHPNSSFDSILLQSQLENWMNEWAPGIQLKAETFPGTNIGAIRIRRRHVESEWMRPTNVGFGVSHSLPIVLVGLLAPEGALFIVDSPESHLHPNGQSAMGQFLATVAASGIQVIIETHSDHIVNGARLAAANPEHPLQPDDTIIYQNSATKKDIGEIEEIHITKTGALDKWPEGFIDQAERDLAKLSRFRKRADNV